MNEQSYWQKRSLSRREALRAAGIGVGGVAALSLAGCGSDDKSSSSSSGGNATTSAIDSTKGNPGGTLKIMLTGPLTVLTLVNSNFVGNYRLGGLVHSGLLSFRWGQESVPVTDFSWEGDLAQALPEQPDETTMTFKLRPGAKFHNGRAVTSEDVRYSFDRYQNLPTSVWKAGWQLWFDRVETPSPDTVVVKTKFPYGDAVEATAANQDGFILAKEHEESPAALEKMMGSGPFLFNNASPPVSWTFKKNPDYYIKPYPYFDAIEVFSTTDGVKRKTDFITKQVHMPWALYADDRDEVKAARPDAKFETYPYPAPVIFMRNDQAPFKDRRVRQALSMTIDRKKNSNAVLKGEGNDDQFFSICHAKVFGTHQVKDLGPSAKYWTYDPAEAKKLLSAAGIDKAIETPVNHYDASVVGQWYVDNVVLMQATWKDLGILNAKLNSMIGAQFAAGPRSGQYEGMSVHQAGLQSLLRGSTIQQIINWGPNGEHSPNNISYINDARLNPLADKQLRQLKTEDRQQTYLQMEPIMAEEQYYIGLSNPTQTWFWDPSIKNAFMPNQQGSTRFHMRWWFDKA